MKERRPASHAAKPAIEGVLSALPEAVGSNLDVSIRAVLAGGSAVMAHYETDDLDVEDRGRGPVTAADRASNEAILSVLQEDRPGEAVLSEESLDAFDGRSRIGELWVVDPLDGTREFIDRIDEFSVMVGVARDGEACLGAVFRPAGGRLYFGAVGHGAWRVELGNPPSVLSLRSPDGRTRHVRLVCSRSHPNERLAWLQEALKGVEVTLSGSAGTKCCLVAEGSADLYAHPVPFLKEWDTCAPEAILQAAGGRVTDCVGNRLRYGKPDPRHPRGIFAAAPATYGAVEDVIARIASDL